MRDNAAVNVTNTFLVNAANNIKGTDSTTTAGSIELNAERNVIFEGGSITATVAS